MLTVKHIDRFGGEQTHETAECRYEPKNPRTEAPETLWIDVGPLTGGTIFVMNSSGKTISRYDLGGHPVGPC